MPHGRHLAIGTQPLSRPGAQEPGYPWDEHVPPPGRDATLLTVVPIPGTQTSLAIVGFAISTSGAPEPGPGTTEPEPGAIEPEPGAIEPGPGATEPGPHNGQPDLAAEPAAERASEPAAERASEPASELLIDHAQRRVWTDGIEMALTFQEFELLAFLSAHQATVFSRADLVTHVWPDRPDRRNVPRDSRTVDVHVSRLRRKLVPVHGQCLVTEHRAGYQFRPPAATNRPPAATTRPPAATTRPAAL